MNTRFVRALFLTLASTSAAAQGTAAPGTPTPAAPAPGAAAQATPVPAAPAGPAKAHICLAPASVETANGTAAQAMSAVRETFTSYLTGPSLEVAPLSARLQSQAFEEAKAANCPYVLFTTVKQTRKTDNGFLTHVAGSALQQGIYQAGSTTNSPVGQIATSSAAGAAGAASVYGGSTQAHDELTLTTVLESPDGKTLVNMTGKKTADSNGQDLLTPLVEKAATAVASAVAKPAQ